jgi:hypothetical protein
LRQAKGRHSATKSKAPGYDDVLRRVIGEGALDWLRRIVEDPRTDRFVMALIVVNAITLGIETSHTVMDRFGWLLNAIDRVVIAVFVLELAARLIVQRASFFRDGWNIFDFIVVGIALAPATEAFSVLRALRVLRILRIIGGADVAARCRWADRLAPGHGVDLSPDHAGLLRVGRDGGEPLRR